MCLFFFAAHSTRREESVQTQTLPAGATSSTDWQKIIGTVQLLCYVGHFIYKHLESIDKLQKAEPSLSLNISRRPITDLKPLLVFSVLEPLSRLDPKEFVFDALFSRLDAPPPCVKVASLIHLSRWPFWPSEFGLWGQKVKFQLLQI